jgi:hypothetical protein
VTRLSRALPITVDKLILHLRWLGRLGQKLEILDEGADAQVCLQDDYPCMRDSGGMEAGEVSIPRY